MRKIYKVLIGCATLMLPYTCMAVTFTIDGINYSSDDGKTASVISNSEKYSGVVVIPSEVTHDNVTYNVTSIGDKAFYECSELKSIEIPNGVTSIGDKAFYGCYRYYFTSISIPSSVISIGDKAFYGCSSLSSIVVDKNNKVYDSRNNCNAIIETASNTMIFGCRNTTIPNSVTSIGRYAFSRCSGLTSIEIPNSVTSIGDEAFHQCFDLTSIDIPSSVTSIGYEAFIDCDNLISITVDKNNKVYDSRNNCNAIIETDSNTIISGCKNTTIPNSVTSIGRDAFHCCRGLTSIEIPNSVTSIGIHAFRYCVGLTSIDIPNSVTSIGAYAFSYCTGLTSIEIPNSVASIGGNPFYECTGITTVYWNAENCSYDDYAIFEGCTNINKFTFGKSVRTIPNRCCAKLAGLTSIEIPNGVTSIGSEAFYYCTGLTSVEIPNGVTSIGGGAFGMCTSITTVYWNAENCSNSNDGGSIFGGCKNIKNFTFGKFVRTIPNGCCAKLTGLTSIDIPNDVTSIGEWTFSGCSGLTSIDIPNSVTSIGVWAFSGCSGLTSIAIPNSVTSIGSSAFSGCTGLTSIEIPNSVTSIGGETFYGCAGLSSIEIPNSVTSIGSHAFGGCTNITTVYWNAENGCIADYGEVLFDNCPIEKFIFGQTVRTIPNYCCNGLNRLTSVEIPNSVTSIGYRAFSGCTGLTSINWNAENCQSISIAFVDCPIEKFAFGESVKVIPDGCCNGLNRLTSVEIPNSVTSIGSHAFGGCTGLTSINWNAENCQSISYNAFIDCPIEKFAFGESVKVIPDGCCGGMNRLTSIEIPNSVMSIGNAAFKGCSSLTSVEISNGVTSIGEAAFNGCTGLSSIEISNSVTSIGYRAFSNCTGLTSIIVDKNNEKYDSRDNCSAIIETTTNTLVVGCKNTKVPNGVTSIGSYAFNGCTGLSSIEIPNSVTSIGNGAFSGCTGLTSIEIPNSVTSIGNETFYGCTGLSSVEIPNGVTSIGFSAFSGCTGISKIWCLANIPPKVYSYTFSDIDKSIPIYVPCGSIEDYKNADGWSEFTNYNCISADPVEEEFDEPTVTPEKTSVVIAWPVDESAETYIINITKGGVTVCTITFDANGNVITIDYPSNGSTKGAELRDANALPNGYSYEITGLEEGTEYVYMVTAQNGSGVTVAEYSGTFRTQGGAVSVEEYNTNSSSSLQNAIIVNGKSISVNGAEPSDIIIYNTAGKQVSNPVPASGVYVVKIGDEAVKVMVKRL